MQRHFVIVFVDPRFAKAKNSDVIVDRLIEHRLHRLKMNKFIFILLISHFYLTIYIPVLIFRAFHKLSLQKTNYVYLVSHPMTRNLIFGWWTGELVD